MIRCRFMDVGNAGSLYLSLLKQGRRTVCLWRWRYGIVRVFVLDGLKHNYLVLKVQI